MTAQTTLLEVPRAGYPSRECRIHDCCDHCTKVSDCMDLIRRCFPRHELVEQCQACKPCKDFQKSVMDSPFRTGLEILREGTSQ